MMTIHKYQLIEIDNQIVSLPKGAKILSCQYQRENLCMWVLVDPDARCEERIIEIVGTGNPMKFVLHGNFIATVQHPKLPLVWHIFER